jgi:hypothetical protein
MGRGPLNRPELRGCAVRCTDRPGRCIAAPGEDAVVAKTHTKSSRPLVGRPASLAHARRRTLDFPRQMFPSSLMQREAPTPNRPWAEPQQFKTSSFRRPESHGAPHYPLYTSPLCSFLAHESHSNKQQPKPSLDLAGRPIYSVLRS